ncbi:MAG: sugar ABC transporter ATP-binding protein [Bacteroidota bacterium]
MGEEALLRLEEISKTFPGIKALDRVSLELRPREIHGLVGENGAGKSTLMNIISGVLAADGGRMFLAGQPVRPANPRAAMDLGVGFVHQELSLCPHLSVAENIFIGRLPRTPAGLVDRAELRRRTARVLAPFGMDFQPDDPVHRLSLAEQQVVEIAKALSLNCRVIIFDEPTSSLTENEAEKLFAIIGDLKDRGLGILFISHRMSEIFRLCDRVTILRDGRHVATCTVRQTTPEQVVTQMVGRDIDAFYPPHGQAGGEVLLRVDRLSAANRFHDISFELRRGEILGFAGLVGAGRTELARAICGIDPWDSGSVHLLGKEFKPREYRDSIRRGLVYLTEDRKQQGLFMNLSTIRNIVPAVLSSISRGLLVNPRAEADVTHEYIEALRIRVASPEQLVVNLSGGNQQKVMLARWLAVAPRVVIMDEPTRGIDVGAKAEIHNLLRELADRGVGVILISSELPEIIGMSDRTIVMHEGRLAGELTGDGINERSIMLLAAGQGG